MLKNILFLILLLSCSLHANIKVLAFAGSTREGSCNKQLIREAAAILREKGIDVTIIDLKNYSMPFYDADLEEKEGIPQMAKCFRCQLMESEYVVIASPEYNGSFPGELKNALDWASRNEEGKPSRDAFMGKKFVLLSASPGQSGGAQGLSHLRYILVRLGGNVFEEQVSVPYAYEALHQKDAPYRAQLRKLMDQIASQN